MIAGQPEHAAAGSRVLERIGDQRRVVHQVGMLEHDALGRARRAGRVLQEGQRVAVDVGMLPIVAPCPRSSWSVASQRSALQVRRFVEQRLHALEHVMRS